MIKAVCHVGHQRIILLGLTGENVTRIVAGEPIAFNANALGIGLTNTTISICYGKQQGDIADQMATAGLLDKVVATPLDTQPPLQPPTSTDHIDVRRLVLDNVQADPSAAGSYLHDAAFHLSIETVIGTLDRVLSCVAETGRHTAKELTALAGQMVAQMSGDRQQRAEDSAGIAEDRAAIADAAARMQPPTGPYPG